MKRLAIVVQRYGEEINGGAELHARLLAMRLSRRYDIEVLTSCALDYADWAMVYPPGPCVVQGIKVIRFAHPRRNDIGRARVALPHKLRFLLRGVLRWLPGSQVATAKGDPAYDGQDFLRRQGPHCEGLMQHLRESTARYDAVLFVTALYAPVADGIRAWGRRSILVPQLHDEKPMYQPVFREVLGAAGALIFNTEAERGVARRLYGLDLSGARVAGAGVEITPPTAEQVQAVLQRHGLTPGYVVYVGRIDVAKGCRELIAAFLKTLARQPSARLVLVGKEVMTVPPHPAITCTGFVSEADRDALIAGAGALVIPSKYESLSLVLLESMLLRTPVIANAACEVLADHIRLSGAGLAYRGQGQLARAMADVPALPALQRKAIADKGVTYVEQHWTWPRVMALFEAAVEEVSAPPDRPAPPR